jgi:branched-chain amino acid transport system permease protein
MSTAAMQSKAQAKPFNTGRWITWGLFAVILLVAPLVFSSPFSRSMLAQMGIAIVACLSFNILLGQGGMLSFGHAVYTGLGSFVAVHAINAISGGTLPIPVSLIPLVGGVAGMFFAVLLGFVTTKKAGTPFAMITLGIGELVFAMSLMIPEFFGGEVGVSANRVVGEPFMGITYASAVQVYYLLAIYTFICTAAMFAFTGTPLGRMLNAVRDNPERVEFIGYEMQRVRYIAFIIAGFFAGVAGGMYAMNFEIATAEVVGAGRSGAYLLFTFLGGATVFFGPIIGAVLMVLAFVMLSELTNAWLLYLGLIFTLMVMFAPGGIASLILLNVRLAKYGKLGRLAMPYLALLLTGLLTLAGGAAIIEMIYHLQLNMAVGPERNFLGVPLNVHAWSSWVGALVVLTVGALLFEAARRRFARHWSDVNTEIARAESRRGEAP